MSIESKVFNAVKDIFKKIDNRIAELRTLRSDVNLLMRRSKEELLNETNKLKAREDWVSKEEERVRQKLHEQYSEFAQKMHREQERMEWEIDRQREVAQSFIEVEIKHFKELLPTNGRLSDAYIKALFYADERVSKLYEGQPRASITAADTIRGFSKENRELRLRIKDLEYLLSEYWSISEDVGGKEDFESIEEDEDAVRYFLSKEDYSRLLPVERNQLALDRFLRRDHNKRWVGLMYEREVGYGYELRGYDVFYRGIELGLKDGGIDLICTKPGEILFVQCKNWSNGKTIYEKHICQLYGAMRFYSQGLSRDDEYTLFGPSNIVMPVFVTTTGLDEQAKAVADYLGVSVENVPFTKDYPMIKCNINRDGERIYHLPFDQMYDKVKINKPGECYVKTAAEAENQGFRRARHWMGD